MVAVRLYTVKLVGINWPVDNEDLIKSSYKN